MDKLKKILLTMDLPKDRVEKMDKNWLVRNIRARNSKHPKLKEALSLLISQMAFSK